MEQSGTPYIHTYSQPPFPQAQNKAKRSARLELSALSHALSAVYERKTKVKEVIKISELRITGEQCKRGLGMGLVESVLGGN